MKSISLVLLESCSQNLVEFCCELGSDDQCHQTAKHSSVLLQNVKSMNATEFLPSCWEAGHNIHSLIMKWSDSSMFTYRQCTKHFCLEF